MRTIIAIVTLLASVAVAQAQQNSMRTPSGQIVPGTVLYCANGITNGDGSQQVAPCGVAGATGIAGAGQAVTSVPVLEVAPVNVTGVNGQVNTSQCPANPLTKKIPPLC